MKIGVVLSGGMAKGAYQIGALRALNKFIPLNEIKYMSCSSIGVLNGYAYATGNLDRAEQMWKNICTKDTRYFISQILKSSLLQYNIKDLYDPNVDLDPRFYCSLFDMNGKSIVYKDLSRVERETLPLYLKASVAMPVYNHSVAIGESAYFDGAMIDNIPVYPLVKHKLDYLICIYFDETYCQFENPSFDSKIIKITFPPSCFIKQSLFFDRDNIEGMICEGYDKTMEILKTVFADGYDNIESVYRAIELSNKENKGEGFRITGDLLVTNLNKITQRLTKRKVL